MSAPPPASSRKRPLPTAASAASVRAAQAAGASRASAAASTAATANVDACERQILAVCAQHDGAGGARQEVIEASLKGKFNQSMMLSALNSLMAKGRLVSSLRANNKLAFKVQSVEEAQKFAGLTAEDRLIFQEVERAGNVGISTKDLRGRANMQHAQVTKVLKKLEVRRLVQQVKSVTAKNKKVYMLCGLEPARELTGGSWYNGGEFDYELISVLSQASFAFVQKKEKATAAEVHEFINGSGLIRGQELRPQDIEAVLQALVYDARIEVTASVPPGGAGAGASSGGGGVAGGGEEEDEESVWFSPVTRLPRIEAMVDSLTSLPGAYCECPSDALEGRAWKAWLDQSDPVALS